MSVNGLHGVTSNTPQNILLGAGTIHKGLAYSSTSGAWGGTIIGSTSGGNSLEIKGEIKDIELDGAYVKVKGLAVKQGGTAKMDVNFAELSDDIIKMGTLFKKETTSDVTGYGLFVDKANIEAGDYIENFGFVGKTANGEKDIIVIFENALCTSGMKIDAKNKDNSVIALTMEAYADNEGDLNTLPVKIYYPPNTTQNQTPQSGQ